jgi:N-methylhydantoinase A
MGYRLGVDVGGTFTDLLLFDETTGAFWRHKTPSTPHDSSEGILTGVSAICENANVDPKDIEYFLHGTTVATNAVLEGKGARVGLITTEGYRHVLQIARSYVPGGLAGWIIWPKPTPLAALDFAPRLDDLHTALDRSVCDAYGWPHEILDDADVILARLLALNGERAANS